MRPPLRYRLPLFPLPAVLLPATPMPLHVFEPRYRRLVERCLETDRRFGVVYHDADVRGPFLSEHGRVGTVGEIRDWEPLPDGRYLLVTRGIARFAIEDGIESEEPYYEALVEDVPDLPSPHGALGPERARAVALFERVVARLRERPERLPELSLDLEVSYPLAGTIQVDPAWLQELLEERRELVRLNKLCVAFEAALSG